MNGQVLDYTFPTDFIFGTATSSYQVEGAWDENGKGMNGWDLFTHEYPDLVADHSSGDIACDSYHQYRHDVEMLKQLGVHFYRFSISWSRILPKGRVNEVNQDGVDYYNNLINELIANNIVPMVTLYHWDLPVTIDCKHGGGLFSYYMADYFEDFARLAFTLYGDRVKWWFTVNEPFSIATGYANDVQQDGYVEYLSGHVFLLSHARAYHVYDKEFREKQGGKIGIVLNFSWFEPMTESEEDKIAAESARQFMLGWFAHPIFSETGDYPEVMRKNIARTSKDVGLYRSRLPKFTEEEIKLLRGTSDFFALNHYTTHLVKSGVEGTPAPSYRRDSGGTLSMDPTWTMSSDPTIAVVPWGFRNALNYIRKEYNNPTILITECGVPDEDTLQDVGRVNYYVEYLKELWKAIHLDGCNVKAFTAWSLMDNFEWKFGYTIKYGLYHVDFKDPKRKRTQKLSAKVYSEIIKSHGIPDKYLSSNVKTVEL